MTKLLLNDNEFLKHFGIKGMKWGVRKRRSKASEAKRREKILKSPRKLRKYRKDFSQAEIDKAVKDMKLNRELHQLSTDKITVGSKYAQAFLSYAGTATAAYGVYRSPAGQALLKKVKG